MKCTSNLCQDGLAPCPTPEHCHWHTPMTPEQMAEAQRQAMNASMNTNGDAGLRNSWFPPPFQHVRLHENNGADFADTEPADVPNSSISMIRWSIWLSIGLGIVLYLLGTVL